MNGLWWTLYDYQTLLAGILAVIAAGMGAAALIISANKPIKAEKERLSELRERRKKYVFQVLKADIEYLSWHSNQTLGSIASPMGLPTSIDADEFERKTTIIFPRLSDWESMNGLPKGTFNKLLKLQQKVFAHNFDMKRYRFGNFSDANFKNMTRKRVKEIINEADAIVKLL